jgi:Fe-S-cluster-containing hydrogenase component 2
LDDRRKEDENMLKVKNELCIGCGVCTKACTTGAISVEAGKAQINQDVCLQCHRCVVVCPRGAIKEELSFTPAASAISRPLVRGWGTRTSLQDLRTSILRLQKNVQMLNDRLHRLENR